MYIYSTLNTKNSNTETPLLWEQADHKRNGELQPVAPPALKEFTHLSQLMDSLPKILEKREMSGEKVEVTPTGVFRTLATMPLDGSSRDLKLVPSVARKKGQNYTELGWGKRRIDSALVEAQAHRDETSPQLYLTLGIKSVTRVEPQFHQYTIHDGHITDVAVPEKEVGSEEIASVKMALSAISEKLLADEEALKAKKLHRKIGKFFSDWKSDINSTPAGG
ncbi:MAG: hypothetical protein WBK76_02650 [Candidatus Saccharimonadales bacterium]